MLDLCVPLISPVHTRQPVHSHSLPCRPGGGKLLLAKGLANSGLPRALARPCFQAPAVNLFSRETVLSRPTTAPPVCICFLRRSDRQTRQGTGQFRAGLLTHERFPELSLNSARAELYSPSLQAISPRLLRQCAMPLRSPNSRLLSGSPPAENGRKRSRPASRPQAPDC